MLALSSLLLLLPALALASGSHGRSGKHHGLKQRLVAGNSTVAPAVLEERGLEKRYGDARLTYYVVETGNAGSCGRYLKNSEYVVAVTDSMMNSGWCGRQVAITANGKTAVATIEDTCPGCPYAALDLSPDLFSFFASHDAGVIYGSWEFTDGAQQPAPEPTPTTPAWTPTLEPTTTWIPEPVTTTSPPPPTTSSAVVATTSSAVPSTTSLAYSASANSTESFTASGSQESDIAPQTISVPGSAPSTVPSRPLAINNLDAIAGLTNLLGAAICRGNELCN